VFKNIALAKIATSAEEAKQLGYFRKTDGVSFDKARVLVDAKAAPSASPSGLPRAHARPTCSRARAASRPSR
jgi:3-hydroxyacyl-CoA dehydrogenase